MQKFRHIYYNVAAGNTPYHFRFSVSSPHLRHPEAFGRPVGIFNADCYGYTLQSQQHDRKPKVDQEEEPNTKRRFPLATGFKDKEEAALECDFWKLVLRHKFYLEIPWSHESFEAYQEAARNAQQEPLDRLADESQWTVELLDFIDQHRAKLLEHRDLAKPELDLDEWMRVAVKNDNWQLRSWVEQIREVQKDLASLPDTKRLDTLSGALNRHRGLRLPVYRSHTQFSADLDALSYALGHIDSTARLCDKVLADIQTQRRALENSLKQLTNNRPPA